MKAMIKDAWCEKAKKCFQIRWQEKNRDVWDATWSYKPNLSSGNSGKSHEKNKIAGHFTIIGLILGVHTVLEVTNDVSNMNKLLCSTKLPKFIIPGEDIRRRLE
jgi:hypothetical protein